MDVSPFSIVLCLGIFLLKLRWGDEFCEGYKKIVQNFRERGVLNVPLKWSLIFLQWFWLLVLDFSGSCCYLHFFLLFDYFFWIISGFFLFSHIYYFLFCFILSPFYCIIFMSPFFKFSSYFYIVFIYILFLLDFLGVLLLFCLEYI